MTNTIANLRSQIALLEVQDFKQILRVIQRRFYRTRRVLAMYQKRLLRSPLPNHPSLLAQIGEVEREMAALEVMMVQTDDDLSARLSRKRELLALIDGVFSERTPLQSFTQDKLPLLRSILAKKGFVLQPTDLALFESYQLWRPTYQHNENIKPNRYTTLAAYVTAHINPLISQFDC